MTFFSGMTERLGKMLARGESLAQIKAISSALGYQMSGRVADVVCTRHENGTVTYDWQGHKDWPVMISDEFKDEIGPELLPWQLVCVGTDPMWPRQSLWVRADAYGLEVMDESVADTQG